MLVTSSNTPSNTPSNTFTAFRPLHIVLVTETWLPDINGVASSLYQLMRQLKQMGHRISLIRPRQIAEIEQQILQIDPNSDSNSEISRFNFCQAIDEQMTVKGVPIPYYASLRMGLPKTHELVTHFQRLQPDIVHIATEGPLGLQAWRAARRCGIKISTGYHTAFHDFSQHFGKSVFAPLLKPIVATAIMGYLRYFHNRCDATCVPSDKTRQELANIGFKNLKVIGRGVDKLLFNPEHRSHELRKAWGAGEQTTVLMYVGRVSPEKGIDTVIKAFRALQLAQLHRDLKLVIVGDGPDKARLMQEYIPSESVNLASQPMTADIIFTGFQTGEGLASHYASADAFVFASQVETFGNVVTEAMASGLPVFAYHDAAAAMLVDSQCGQTVRVGDEAAFIDMIAHLPKQHQLHAMRHNAETKVADFGWQKPANDMLAMFYAVLGVEAELPQLVDFGWQQPVKNQNFPRFRPSGLPILLTGKLPLMLSTLKT